MNFNRSKLLFSLLLTIILVMAYVLCLPMVNTKVATKAVNYMYTFNSYEELCNENMPKLEKLCTDEMVGKLTIKNHDLLETVYYRFRGFKTEAQVIEVNSNINSSRIVFKIKNKMIDEERLFSLELKFNLLGQVTDAKLYELLKQYI